MNRPVSFLSFAKRLVPTCLCFVYGAALAADDPIPTLRPPHAELPPSYWELYGWLTVAGAALALAVLVLFIAWLLRPKPQEITSPKILARRALAALHRRAEDAGLIVEVSRILRHYVLSVFGLPAEELTTAEIRQALQNSAPIDPELAAAVTDFLRECDELKFAPSPCPPSAQIGLVNRALALVEKIEASQNRPLQAAPPVTASGPVAPAAS